MAGLLTFPSLLCLPSLVVGQWHDCKQTLNPRGLQLQVQFRTLTGFPCIDVAQEPPDYHLLAAQRYYFFHQPPTKPQKNPKMTQNLDRCQFRGLL